MAHSIRLRGPWEYQPLARYQLLPDGCLQKVTNDLPPGGTLDLPADWGPALGQDFQGIVRFSRRFHCPTGLDAHSRVWLVLEDVDASASIDLNDRFLGRAVFSRLPESAKPDNGQWQRCPARFEITGDLRPLNQLSITVSSLIAAPDDSRPYAGPGDERKPGGLIGLVQLEIE